jgi:uncharacterized membrane protein YphA (DoxX/SURF4 family)
MKTKAFAYWATTGMTALAFLAGGAMDVIGGPKVAAIMGHLGYPTYFAAILGTWKVLGALALLVPRFPRLKEWAYAGIMFDLTGAALSHAFTGDAAGNVVTPLVLAAIAVASWALRPQSRAMVVATRATTTTPALVREPRVAA